MVPWPETSIAIPGGILMIRTMLLATVALQFVVGLTFAADPEQMNVNGTFVKYDGDKSEITIKVNGEKEMSFMMARDAKVSVGEVKNPKDLSKLRAGDPVTLTLTKDGDRNMVTEVKEGKRKGRIDKD
jgi:hypothetical protein